MSGSDFPASAPTADPVFYRTYSRRKETEDGQTRRETWLEVVDRNLEGLAALGKLNEEQVTLLRDHQLDLTALPSGRWLWVGGTPWLERPENYSGAYNCTSTEIIDWRSLYQLMNLAMMGSGTGAVLEARNIEQLPPVCNEIDLVLQPICMGEKVPGGGDDTLIRDDRNGTMSMSVGDSRQGWCQAYYGLLMLACDSIISSTKAIRLHVDLAAVRPAGSPLRGFGGTANPAALPDMFRRLVKVLNGAVGRKLNSLECCLLIDEAARCVVAGNVRRSAGMRQFDANDPDATGAKHNLWQQGEDGVWALDPAKDALRMANHTRVFHHLPSLEEVTGSLQSQYQCGEGAIQYAPEAVARGNVDLLGPGWIKEAFLKAYTEDGQEGAKEFLRNMGVSGDELEHRVRRYGLNPCGEIIGSDFHCNLAEVHLNQLAHASDNDVDRAFEAAALSVAALLNHRFREGRYQNSRELDPIVGVSFTGLFDFLVARFGIQWLEWWAEGRPPSSRGSLYRAEERRLLRRFREVVEAAVYHYCDDHGLKCPNRCTTVQPAGTKSLLTNASPGWHPPKSARYIRRITFGKEDPVAMACMDHGYSVVPSQSDKDENGQLLDDPFDPRCTEWLVEIPVEHEWARLDGADKIDIHRFSALAQFDFYMQVQRHYTTHNTSATIEFREDEIEPLAKAIHVSMAANRGYISAALLARHDAKETFPRMPYEPIDQATYDRLQGAVLERRGDNSFLEALQRYDQVATPASESGPAGCDSDKCLLPSIPPG